MLIYMSSRDLTAAERAAVAQVLNTTHLSIGPRLDAIKRTGWLIPPDAAEARLITLYVRR